MLKFPSVMAVANFSIIIIWREIILAGIAGEINHEIV